MKKEYKIEKVGHEELEKVARLYRICFGKDRSVDFFKWKYFANPAGEALCLAAKEGSGVIGSCAMIPEDFYIFGKRMKIYKCCDLMVHPEHRKKGMATALIKSLSEHLEKSGRIFLYTFCGKNATPGFLKNGWSKMDDIGYYFKHKAHLGIQSLFKKLDRLYDEGVLKPIGSALELCRSYRFNTKTDGVSIVKDERYLDWRLKDPRYNYIIVGAYEKDALKGYVIYNTGIHDNAYIIDLEAEGGDQKVIGNLLASAESAAYRSGRKAIIALTVKDTPFQKMVKRHGYIANPFGRGPLASILDFNILIDRIYDAGASDRVNWDLRPLNYDDI